MRLSRPTRPSSPVLPAQSPTCQMPSFHLDATAVESLPPHSGVSHTSRRQMSTTENPATSDEARPDRGVGWYVAQPPIPRDSVPSLATAALGLVPVIRVAARVLTHALKARMVQVPPDHLRARLRRVVHLLFDRARRWVLFHLGAVALVTLTARRRVVARVEVPIVRGVD